MTRLLKVKMRVHRRTLRRTQMKDQAVRLELSLLSLVLHLLEVKIAKIRWTAQQLRRKLYHLRENRRSMDVRVSVLMKWY